MTFTRSHLLRVLAGLPFLAALLALPATGAFAQERDPGEEGFYQSYVFGTPDEPSPAWTIAYGGRLYDRWWAVLLTDPPEETHPAYPASGGRSGGETWSCVACHGWDYRGRDGQASGDRDATGIIGLGAMVGAAPERVVAVLRDETHGYGENLIPDAAAEAIAQFVTNGQVEMADLIDPDSKAFRGDAEHGRAVFQNVCAICHDFDGRAWIEDEELGTTTLGNVAKTNPWRTLHKVMNGQTYADMPAMRVFGVDTVVDILTYVQTLPTELD